jgi:glyoxylase-like metal-dependent hydrolase (beta-lactamase superfamily II)
MSRVDRTMAQRNGAIASEDAMKCVIAVVAIALCGFAPQAQTLAVKSALIADRGLTAADFPRHQKIAENVYVWSDLHPSGIGYTTNNLIVVAPSGVLVADGQGSRETTQKMVGFIRTLTDRPIQYVVVCSEHGDHTGGNASFPPTATLIASPVSKANLESRAESKRGSADRGTPGPIEAVASRKVIAMGIDVEVLNLGRAHTGGDLVVYLPRERILFTSEVFSNGIFPSMASAFPSEWIETLKKVERVDARIVLPGHGFIDDAGVLKAALVNFRQALEYVVREVKRLHAEELTVDEAVKQARWGPYAAWSVVERNAPRAVQRIYDELDGKVK